tara:strand:- start:198 stop:1001 length:804 start_codon:yes stop_codon:yes gene_type:complete
MFAQVAAPAFDCMAYTDSASVQTDLQVNTANVFEPMPDPRELHPEYLTDPAILVCPSDATLTTDAWTTPQGANYFHKVCDGDDDHGSRAGQDSYLYFGHIFDQCNSDDRTIDGALIGYPGAGNFCLQSVLWDVAIRTLQAWPSAGAEAARLSDVNVSSAAVAVGQPDDRNYGSGSGESLLRFREGVERFMITDINNAAASSKAQSEVYVYFDIVSTTQAIGDVDFSHVPGGANVLFMDGHVEFQKYDTNGDAPANGNTARAVGAIIR